MTSTTNHGPGSGYSLAPATTGPTTQSRPAPGRARPEGPAAASKEAVRNSFGNSERGSANSDFLTVPEAGEYLNTSDRFVRRMVEERRIAFHRFGRHLRFARTDLDAFVAAGRVEIPPSRRIA